MKLKKKSNAVRIPPIKKAIKVKRKSSDVEGESTVSKALKNVKKVLEDKNAGSTKKESILRVKSRTRKPTKKIIKTKKERTRGLVYVGHIPHGFYEEQMEDYFKQFGKVTRVRVSRSKNTGKSRGYGYVEFEHSDVAKIAADTMNNYLMCDRLLKATYLPPEKQHTRFFAGTPWTSEVYPKLINRNTTNSLKNNSTRSHKSFVQSTQDKLSALEQKLKGMGVDLTFAPNDTKA
ncbi:MKI67 FHA domain-interacting nucleolar phosphoprotein [Lasioglossum baleicum]|uniref:MKI67 FHA domain-interacting nucleolar phosphoprotein n=1 Tax=Lasioglossum baleicum TaxID=434251 RepID=UPI003FCD1F0F